MSDRQSAWPADGAALFAGRTWHGRRSGPANAFAYNVDLILARMAPAPTSPFLSRRRFSPFAVCDRDHGIGEGAAVDWARRCAAAFGLPDEAMAEVWLLTQPRRFGYVFNPVSFWFFRDAAGEVRAALAEVNNTYGDRHAYFCATDGFAPIDGGEIVRPKRMHVSPFQKLSGEYKFTFAFKPGRIAIAIDHRADDGGMRATLAGDLEPFDARAALRLMIRPFSAVRVILLIHWQALKLVRKGTAFMRRPLPPKKELTG